MVTYYNFTQYQNNDGIIGFMRSTSILMNYYFGLFLVVLVFLIPMITMLRRGDNPTSAINVSSLYATLMAIFLFLAQVVVDGILILIPALVFIVTTVVKWYQNE